MTTTSKAQPRLRYHQNAYPFVFAALRHADETLNGQARAPVRVVDPSDADADHVRHLTGQQLLEGVRSLARKEFGLLATVVFRQWGIRSTEDIGRMVFEMVERGEMLKTDRDTLEDFTNVYDFHEAFDVEYQIDTSQAFRP